MFFAVTSVTARDENIRCFAENVRSFAENVPCFAENKPSFGLCRRMKYDYLLKEGVSGLFSV